MGGTKYFNQLLDQFNGNHAKYDYIIGPNSGTKDHSPAGKFISLGFVTNYPGGPESRIGNGTLQLTGFSLKPFIVMETPPIGNKGSVGYKGSRGITGYIGSPGFRGSEGYKGSVGYQGSAGVGTTGYQG
jgi:hypothetical protein